MFSLFIGLICIIGLVIGTILSVSDFGIFFDAPAFGIVIVGAFLYSIAAGGEAVAHGITRSWTHLDASHDLSPRDRARHEETWADGAH